MQRLATFLLSLFFVSLWFDSSQAQWVFNGTRVCAAFGGAYPAGAVTDGAGGAIIVWQDSRSLIDDDIYIRRINSAGTPLWTADGVAVCTAVNTQTHATLVADGAGGAIVAWEDRRGGANGDIYVQHINSGGAPTWTANGVALCTAANEQLYPEIASDGAGGAIVVWMDLRSGTSFDIYARRINSAGVPQWTADGVGVAVVAGGQLVPHLIEDGSGGAIMVWGDSRGAAPDLYAQRLNSAGAPQWTANGKAVTAAQDAQTESQMISDGAGGAIVCWRDQRFGVNDIYAERINSAGTPQWAPDDRAVCVDPGAQVSPRLASDGAGGAIIAWDDYRSNVKYDIYAQRLNPSGTRLWTADGVALCTAAEDQNTAAVISDAAQGAIVVWEDYRPGSNTDIYAQRVNANGFPMWNADGSAVCTADNNQGNVAVTSDGGGGVIAAWDDQRSGLSLVYAQRVEPRYGYGGRPEPVIGPAVDNPSDQGGQVIVRWTASLLDTYIYPGITYYSVWRSTDSGALMDAKGRSGAAVAITDPRALTRDFSGVAIWEETTASATAYWEWVGNLDAFYQPKYSMTAPTRQDSTLVNPATTYFKVLSHESPGPGSRTWESGSASARSVDNVAPSAPILLTIQQSGGNAVLAWKAVDAIDLSKYALYRQNSSGVSVSPVNFLIDETLTHFTDVGAGAGSFFYVVTAIDIHGNQSAPSNEVSLSGATGTGGVVPPLTLVVGGNAPNPFTATSAFRVGLPRDGEVRVAIYDVAGREVSHGLVAGKKGWQSLSLDGRDGGGRALASGVYFYRVTAAGTTMTRKMVIAR